MKRFLALLVAGSLVGLVGGLVGGCRATDDADAVGFRGRAFFTNQPVAVQGQARTWNIGVITGVHRFLYSVLHGDGRQSLVVASEMIPVPRSPKLDPNDRVLACRDGSRMYAGTVLSKVDGVFTIRWNDGAPPSEVPAGKLVRAPHVLLEPPVEVPAPVVNKPAPVVNKPAEPAPPASDKPVEPPAEPPGVEPRAEPPADSLPQP